MKGKFVKKIVVAITALALAFTVMPAAGAADTYAATKVKTPSAPTITSGKAEGAKITIKWKSAKNAKKYQVALRTSYMGWKYLKKVKKTKANKAKYNKAKLYKTVAGKGKNKNKYYVYKYQRIYKYKTLKSATTSKNYTYSAPKRNTTYTLAVRSLNGKKHSGWRVKSVKTWSADTVRIDGAVHTHTWATREKHKTAYKTVEYLKDYIVCKDCGQRFIVHYRDADGVWHDYVERWNPEGWYTSCPEATAHKKEEAIVNGKTGSTYDETEEYKTEKVAYKVPYTETYCTGCGAVKNTSGTVTLHTHTWATREKYKTAYKTVTYGRTIIVCKDCGKRFPVKYRDGDGVWHDYVEKGNPEGWYSDCPEGDEHEIWEILENNGTGSTYSETEDYKTEKVAYKVPYTETYCTSCGKIK